MGKQPAIILAGGGSVRMGTDKAELRLGSARLIDAVHSRLKLQNETIYISAVRDYGLSCPVIADHPDGPKGPVAALYSAWQIFKENSGLSGFFTVPVDGPNFPGDLIQRLYNPDGSAIAADPDQRHPTFAWWRFDDLETVFQLPEYLAAPSLLAVAEKIKARPVIWADENLFFNINTPEDIQTFLTRQSLESNHMADYLEPMNRSNDKSKAKADREARLAENLRRNLRRRKAAGRKTASVNKSDKPT